MALLSGRLFDSVARGYLPGLGWSCHDQPRTCGAFWLSKEEVDSSHYSENAFYDRWINQACSESCCRVGRRKDEVSVIHGVLLSKALTFLSREHCLLYTSF